MKTLPTKLTGAEWNRRFADERVDHIGQPDTALHTKKIWRTTAVVWGGRSTQIDTEGNVRSVDTDALYNGGSLKAKYYTDKEVDKAKGVFTLLEEEL